MLQVLLIVVALSACQAAPAEQPQSSAELLERLRKIATPPRRSRPSAMMPDLEQSSLRLNEGSENTTPMTLMTQTLTPALPLAEPEKYNETPAPSSGETHSYVLVPVTDQNTISQVHNQVNNFQTTNDPYNQIQVVPFRPPLIGNNNNYLNYLNYMNGRQQTIVDRFTNFASNFFPVEIDVPDLVGSLTSWIPGANLIGQILTGNRPNRRRFAVLGGNGQVYIVDVPINPIQPLAAPSGIPYIHPIQAPFENFRSPLRPYTNQMVPFDNFVQRFPQPIPQEFSQRFQNVQQPFPMNFPGLRMQNVRPDLMESRTDDTEPELQESGFRQNGYENSPNVNVLPNQMFNGNLHIPAEGLLYPRGRSMDIPK